MLTNEQKHRVTRFVIKAQAAQNASCDLLALFRMTVKMSLAVLSDKEASGLSEVVQKCRQAQNGCGLHRAHRANGMLP